MTGVPPCVYCSKLHGPKGDTNTCEAYPEGIPGNIIFDFEDCSEFAQDPDKEPLPNAEEEE